jgi:DNA-binding MarR family transcriptional regulator
MGIRGRTEVDAVSAIVAQWHTEAPDLDVSALEVLGRMHRSYLRYQSSLNALFESFGINTASFDVLAALRRSGKPYRMTSGQLATSSLVTTGGITLRLDRLEGAGLVKRIREGHDRRVVFAQLTPKGVRLIDEVAKVHFENENKLLSGLTDAERKRLSALLQKLEASIEAAAE